MQPEPSSVGKARILHVEDDLVDADWFARVVERMASERTPRGSLEIIHCSCLSEALECLRFAEINVIVLDVCLPDASPARVISAVRAAAPGVPMIVLSSRSYAEMCGVGLAKQVYGYVSKNDASPVFLGEVLRNTLDLSQAQTQFRSVIHRSADGMVVVDAAGLVRFANPAAASIFGLSLDDLRGHPFGAPVMGGECAEIQIGVDRSVEMRVVDIEWDGRPAHLASLRDVTERKRADAALRASEERLRAMSDTAHDAIVTFDDGGAIVDWNPAAERIFGRSRVDAIGRSVGTLVTQQDRSHLAPPEPTDGELTTRGFPVIERLSGIRADGNAFPMEASLARWRASGGTFTTGFFRDVTDRTVLEQRLASSQRMEAMGRLAGGVAHDFNNLLTAVMIQSEMALLALPEGHPIREHLAGIREAGTRAAKLTRQLLAFSRRQPIAPVVVNLSETLTHAERMLRHLIGEHIDIVTHTSNDLGAVWIDPTQLEQVIVNLVVNGKDAMPRGGTLTIELANVDVGDDQANAHPGLEAGPYVLMTVSDTGEGMDPQTMSRIFEPFFTTKDEEHGTGLGLATVYGIVEQNGGYIEVTSEVGRGTAFRIYLRRISDAARQVPQPPPTTAALTGSESILIVEDEEVVRRVAGMALRAQGYRVLEAASPDEALTLCESIGASLELLITDVVMPRMNGYELSRRLVERFPDIQVLFISGYVGDTLVAHGAFEGAGALLQKPFGPTTLVRKARELLDTRGAKALAARIDP